MIKISFKAAKEIKFGLDIVFIQILRKVCL